MKAKINKWTSLFSKIYMFDGIWCEGTRGVKFITWNDICPEIGKTIIHFRNVKYKSAGQRREVFLGEGGRPSKVAEGRHFLFDILYFWCILFNIWRRVDIYLVISSLWVLFPGGSHFFVSLWLFDLGYLGFFIGIKYFYDLLIFEMNHFHRVGGCKYKVASLLKEQKKNCKF